MKNTVPELDKLFDEVGTYRKSTDYMELLNFVKKFPQMAPYNATLVHVQKPGSEFVASAYEWKTKYSRFPKAGARPLVILRPFGPISFVFELNDTEGRPFPIALLEPFKAEGTISENEVESLTKSMLCEGVTSIEQDFGTSCAGSVEAIQETREHTMLNKTDLYHIWFGMILNRNLDPTAKIATIFHELGHVFCGHLRQPNAKWLRERYTLPIAVKEFEAESVCWLVCEWIGIKNPSAEYLSGYLDSNNEIPAISIDAVLKAAGLIESILAGKYAPRKELIMKKN